VDHVVNRANELGLVMGLVTAKSWHVNRTPEQVFDEQNAYTFGRFLAGRYKDNAVIWYPGGDSVPGRDGAVWVAMARGLRDGCGGTRLISSHGSGQTSSSAWYHNADRLDLNTIQSGHTFGSDSYASVSKDHAMSPAKPTVDMEPAYENHPTGAGEPRADAHKVRTQAYVAMLAGAAGHAYGSLDLFWFFKPGDGPFPRDGFMDWRAAMNDPAAGQMRALRRLFGRRPWYRLMPDQSVPASDPGSGPFRVVAARARDNGFVIAHAPEGKPLSIHMDQVSGKAVKAQWYDPREHRIGVWRRRAVVGHRIVPHGGTIEALVPGLSPGSSVVWLGTTGGHRVRTIPSSSGTISGTGRATIRNPGRPVAGRASDAPRSARGDPSGPRTIALRSAGGTWREPPGGGRGVSPRRSRGPWRRRRACGPS
jgi:hypothetical protein